MEIINKIALMQEVSKKWRRGGNIICDPEKLTDMKRVDRPCLLALAVRVGKTGLIDNLILREN